MKKELSGGVIAGVIAVVVVIVAILAWKMVLAPPSGGDAPHITKAMTAAHDKSAADIRADQMRRAAQMHGGGQ